MHMHQKRNHLLNESSKSQSMYPRLAMYNIKVGLPLVDEN